ncbi:hypothetical protein QCA50_007851 [Cerrena zonata]
MMVAGLGVAVWYSCLLPLRLRRRQQSSEPPAHQRDVEKYDSTMLPSLLRDPGSPDTLNNEKAFSPDIGHEALTPHLSPTTGSDLNKLDGASTPTLALLFKQGKEADLTPDLAIPEPAHSFERRIRFSTPPDGHEAVWWFY